LIVESARPATVHVPALRDALSLSVLRELDGEPLIGFLRRQRWFGSKGLAAATARFRDVIPLFREPMIEAAIARVEITVGEESIATYQLTLAVRRGEASDAGVLAVTESDAFAYATAVTVKQEARTSADARRIRAEADALTTEMQRTFRSGYFCTAPSAPILPASSHVTEGLLTIFEIEKAFYELAYELNNRPSWADIPLAGIRELSSRPLPDPRRLPQ
jgi:Maltokinase N-terminal cap domain